MFYTFGMDRYCINDVPLGETHESRIGRQIHIIAIDIQCMIMQKPFESNIDPENPSSNLSEVYYSFVDTLARTVLVLDKQPNNDNISKNELYLVPDTLGAITYRNPLHMERFHVMAEQKDPLAYQSFVTNPNSSSSTITVEPKNGSPTVAYVDWHVPCDIVTTFSTKPDNKPLMVTTNAISLCTLGTSPFSSFDRWKGKYECLWTSRIAYFDV